MIRGRTATLLLAVAFVGGAAGVGAGASGPREAPSGPPWDCVGVPSPGDGVFRSEPAFVADTEPDAAQQAIERARRNLYDRLCGGRSDCAELAAAISPWKQGLGGGHACALAVIEAPAYRAWLRKTTPAELREKLRPAAEELIRKAGFEGKAPRFVFGAVQDDEVPGGRRVEALLPLMALPLQDAGAVAAPPLNGIPYDRLPSGIDLVIGGSLVSEPGGTVRVSWTALARSPRRGEKPRLVYGEPFLVPASLLGSAPGARFGTLPPSSDALWVELDARVGGGLCAGQSFHMYVHSDRRRHIRVIDLYGEDRALVIFPNAAQPDDVVPAGRRVSLAGDGAMVASPSGVAAERYLILAAEREEDLGAFAALRDYCHIPRELARGLHEGKGLPPGATAASSGYRLREGAGCPPPSPTAPSAERIEAWLRDVVPECPIR